MSKPFAAQRDEFIIIANSFFDDVMPKLSGNEFKVLSFIIRKTRGWQKDRDRISASQMIAGTGIKSTNTITEAAEHLAELGYIIAERQNGVPTTYILNLDYETPYQNLTSTLSKFDEVPYQNLTTQKNTEIQTKDITRTRVRVIPQNEAIRIYGALTGCIPNDDQRRAIAEHVTDIPLWEKSITTWRTSGWKDTNVQGMIELYKRGGVVRQNATPPRGNGAPKQKESSWDIAMTKLMSEAEK